MAASGTAPADLSTRQRLLGAAVEVFLDQGYEQARVQDIARAAGMTTGAIYSQYRGKADLLLDAVTERTRAEVDEMLALTPGAEARHVLAALGIGLATSAAREPTLLVDVAAASRRDRALAEQVGALIARREATIVDLLERARAAGDLDPALDPAAVARLCMTILFGTLCLRNLELPAVRDDAWGPVFGRILDAAAPVAVIGAAPPTIDLPDFDTP